MSARCVAASWRSVRVAGMSREIIMRDVSAGDAEEREVAVKSSGGGYPNPARKNRPGSLLTGPSSRLNELTKVSRDARGC